MPNVKMLDHLKLDAGDTVRDIPVGVDGIRSYTIEDFAIAIPGAVVPIIVNGSAVAMATIMTCTMEKTKSGVERTTFKFAIRECNDAERKVFGSMYGRGGVPDDDGEYVMPGFALKSQPKKRRYY